MSDDVKEPHDFSEEEQEARQTGKTVEQVRAKNAKPPGPKADAPRPKAKSPPKSKGKSKGNGKGKSAHSGVASRKALGKRGPKGWPESKRQRNAPDEGKFGRAMARARKALGLSQAALAAKCDLTQPAICNIEKGTAGTKEATEKKIRKALRM